MSVAQGRDIEVVESKEKITISKESCQCTGMDYHTCCSIEELEQEFIYK